VFTGLVGELGTVAAVEETPAGVRLAIDARIADELAPGDSVAVNGVCLTAIAHADASFDVDIGPETLAVTSFGTLGAGALVNLERAMRADGRFGGHLVLGHVDGAGTIESIRPQAEFSWISVGYPRDLAPLLIHRGSVAVDGISLTVATLDADRFDVQVVPFTLAHTNLRSARQGDPVNLEFDMVGKYVLRAVHQHAGSGLSRIGKDL